MLIENGAMSPADFSALMGNRNDGFFGGSQGWWILLLFLFAGGWGNGGFGNNNGAIPYMMNGNTQADIQRGFDQQSLMAGIGNLNNTVSNGFANAEVSRCNAQMNLLQTLNNNQLATYQGLNQLAMGQQVANSNNQAGLADLKYTVATENCADRQAISDGLRDVLSNNNSNTNAIVTAITNGIQSIKDDLCQDRLDAANRQIAQLQSQLNMANLAASQTAQTAQLIQDNNLQTANLIRAINPSPVPSYNVPNPYTGCCGAQNYCGCGA